MCKIGHLISLQDLKIHTQYSIEVKGEAGFTWQSQRPRDEGLFLDRKAESQHERS